MRKTKIALAMMAMLVFTGCSTFEKYGMAPAGYLVDKACEEPDSIPAKGARYIAENSSKLHLLKAECFAKVKTNE